MKSPNKSARRSVDTSRRPATPLNVPRLHFYDRSLVMAAEAAKFRQADFSDCHWCTLLLLAYKTAAYTEADYNRDKKAGCVNGYALRYSSALEMVLRTYVQRGPQAAKNLAAQLEKEGETFPPWMKLPTSPAWRAQLAGPPPRFRFDAAGFICGEDQRPLDGD